MAEDLGYHCQNCNSPRTDTVCWKCGTETFIPDASWPPLKLPDIELIRSLAKSAGYALAVHGSLERDLDLIAVPWVSSALSPDELIRIIVEGANAREAGIREVKPHGRLAVNLRMSGWYKLIDLSICPMQKETT